jgi:hypothetical protein
LFSDSLYIEKAGRAHARTDALVKRYDMPVRHAADFSMCVFFDEKKPQKKQ